MKKFAGFSILLVLAVGSNHFFLKRLTTASSFDSVVEPPSLETKGSTASSSFAGMDKKERVKPWWELTESLLVCKRVPSACAGLQTRLKFSLVAGAKMRYNVMGLGGCFLSFLGLVCACIGIVLSERWSNTHNKEKVDSQYQSTQSEEDVEVGSSNRVHVTFVPPANSFWKRLSNNAMTYWSGTNFTFTCPAITFKIFLALLLVIELNHIMAPESSVLATPETVQLHREHPDTNKYIPRIAEWLMPSLNNDTADLWVERLNVVRGWLLASWFIYLLLPPGQIWSSGTSYAIGAIAYVYLGSIGLSYNRSHSVQGGLIFLFFSIFAVPFLGCPKHGPRAARWLRRFLYLGVLVPIYLFAGICKLRYKGLASNITGEWISKLFEGQSDRSALPTVHLFIGDHRWAAAFFSWGNLIIEFVLPLAVVLWMENGVARALFHISSILFHISVFLLMGPNFARYSLFHLLACDPLAWCCQKQAERDRSVVILPITWRDWFRAGITVYVLVSWFWVQLFADVLHLTEKLDPKKSRNPYFPFPELSMFGGPTKDANYLLGFFLVVMSSAFYISVIFSSQNGQRQWESMCQHWRTRMLGNNVTSLKQGLVRRVRGDPQEGESCVRLHIAA